MPREYLKGKDRIIQDPAIMVGKPAVRGTRIPVDVVLHHLADDLDLDDLFAAFPDLMIDDVKACLAYASATLGRHRVRFGNAEKATGRAAHV